MRSVIQQSTHLRSLRSVTTKYSLEIFEISDKTKYSLEIFDTTKYSLEILLGDIVSQVAHIERRDSLIKDYLD